MVHGVRRKLSGGQAGTYLDSVCPRCVASIPQDPFAAATTAASASPAFSQPVRVSSQPFIDSSGASAPGAFYRHDHTGLVRDKQGLHLFVGAAPPPSAVLHAHQTEDDIIQQLLNNVFTSHLDVQALMEKLSLEQVPYIGRLYYMLLSQECV